MTAIHAPQCHPDYQVAHDLLVSHGFDDEAALLLAIGQGMNGAKPTQGVHVTNVQVHFPSPREEFRSLDGNVYTLREYVPTIKLEIICGELVHG